jgi:hypothetical protein
MAHSKPTLAELVSGFTCVNLHDASIEVLHLCQLDTLAEWIYFVRADLWGSNGRCLDGGGPVIEKIFLLLRWISEKIKV